MKKRHNLHKQFILTFINIFLLSLLTSVVLIIMTYDFIYVKNEPIEAYRNFNLSKLTSYIDQHGSSMMQEKNFNQLKKLVGKKVINFYITDPNNRTIYNYRLTDTNPNKIRRVFQEENQRHHAAHIFLPITDQTTGDTLGTLVLVMSTKTNDDYGLHIELGIPFICFGLFTIILAGKLSRKIKKPLNELMDATEKIKNRDLDFTITNNENNEIGDLARALEDMRKELNQSLIREWQLEQDRRDMVAALTHDLRTPLAIIQGHVEGLQEGLKNDPQQLKRYLQTIASNTARVKGLIDEMNLLAEVDSIDFILNSTPVNLARFLEEKFEDLRVLTSRKEIELITEIHDDRKEKSAVLLDSNRLTQVIENITGNSLRFTPTGGKIKIIVTIEDTKAAFQISDTGPGFSEKDLPHLFKKFYKGDPSRSLEKGHSGMGLYIAEKIIEKFGGQILASNNPEGGAVIQFSINLISKSSL